MYARQVALVAALAALLCLAEAQTPALKAAAAVTQMQSWYLSDEGQWDIPWWHSGNVLTTLCDFCLYTNNSSFDGLIGQVYTSNKDLFPDYEGYDDEGWWGLAWVQAYKLTRNKAYLATAATIFENLSEAWNDTCGGGVWWDRARTYKNAITNELFFSLAGELYQLTNDQTYLDWSQRSWKWFSGSSLINQHNLINDGLDTTTCKNNGQTVWTYNQGVVLGGLAALYGATKQAALLDAAHRIANATIHSLVTAQSILQESCELNKACNGDQVQFKGVFMRNLGYLYTVTRDPAYGDFIAKNALSIWDNDRSSNTSLGLYWAGPVDAADAARQSSALDALNAAILVQQ